MELTPDQIDAVLADFRDWLSQPQADSHDEVDLVGQFTALRHDVTLLTKATRTQTEQTAAVLDELQNTEPAPVEEVAKPMITAALEAADTLDRAAEAIIRLVEGLPEPINPGLIQRMAGVRDELSPIRDRLSAAAEGLQLGRQHYAAALKKLGAERVPTLGEPFDPETMEALEAVACGQPPGMVVEEIRAGYQWQDRVFRCAQVRVAK